MPGFPKPFDHDFDVNEEVERLRIHKADPERGVPDRDDDHLLLATWNIANLGAKEQVRETECFDLIAEIVGWFDLVAVQEVRDDVDAGIRELKRRLPDTWQLIFSETGGNDEKFAFLWDSRMVDAGELVGKVTFEPQDLERAGGPGFLAFSRTPYVATFHRGDLLLEVVSNHSFFGDAGDPIDMARRLAETRALAYWCERNSKNPEAYTKDIVAVGDFNTPSEDDLPLALEMLEELRKKGLHTPRYGVEGENLLETFIGTAVRSENHYDHLLFSPKDTGPDIVDTGVFDFDGVIFRELWEDDDRTEDDFEKFTIWAVSDHRPLWAKLKAPA